MCNISLYEAFVLYWIDCIFPDCVHVIATWKKKKNTWFQWKKNDIFKLNLYSILSINICSICACALSHVWHIGTPWTVACQALLSMEFSRQGYWSGLPFLSIGGLPDPGMELRSFALQVDSLLTEPAGKTYITNINNNCKLHR